MISLIGSRDANIMNNSDNKTKETIDKQKQRTFLNVLLDYSGYYTNTDMGSI